MGTDAILSRELMDLLSALKTIVRREILKGDAEAKAPTLTQLRILHKIKKGVRHVGKLAGTFGISQPATSIMVNKMVKDGFIKRVAHPTDRRQIELHLTPKAVASLETGHNRAFAEIERKLSPLSSTQKGAISKQIRVLSRLLSEEET